MDIRIIEFNSEEYRKSLELRNKILRIPLGLNLYDENLENEYTDTHVGAFIDEKLVGILILTDVDFEKIKMRQVAVDDEFQGMGIGTAMIRFCEKFALEQGYGIITMHARKSAMKFYLKQGYIKLGKEFFEVNVPHFEMMKIIDQ